MLKRNMKMQPLETSKSINKNSFKEGGQEKLNTICQDYKQYSSKLYDIGF